MGDSIWRTRTRTGLLLTLAGVAFALPAAAQFVQYTPPGTFRGRRAPMDETLERAMQTARWKAGRNYFDPWFGFRTSYNDRSGGFDEPDVSVRLGLGVRGYRPVGSETTLAVHVLPEYVWWREFSERNRLNGRYGIGFFGNLGRTGFELSATRVDDAVFFSREFEEKVNTRMDEGKASLEFDVGRGFSVVTGGVLRAIRYLSEEDDILPFLSTTDRDETLLRLGVGLPSLRGFKFDLGAEYSKVEFEPGVNDLSNSGTSPVLLVKYETEIFYLNSTLVYRLLDPEGATSEFVSFEGLTGRFEFSWRALNRLEPQLYFRNDLVYSFTNQWAYYEDRTVGLALKIAATRWSTVRIFGETGKNPYTLIEPGNLERTDDFDTIGGDIGFTLGRFTISFGAWRTEYTSNLPQFDRTNDGVRAGLGLSLGGGGPWG